MVQVTHLAVGAHEQRHVLHHADHGQPHLAAELDLLAHVQQRHLLRSGHHDGARDSRRRQVLH